MKTSGRVLLTLLLLSATFRPLKAFFPRTVSPAQEYGTVAVRSASMLPPAVALRADRTTAQIAEPIHVTLQMTAPPGWTVRPPPMPSRFGELHVIRAADDLKRTDAGISATRRMVLEAYAAGRHQIEPLEVWFTSPADSRAADARRSLRHQTPPLQIHVRSALGDVATQADLRDIHGAIRAPWTWWQWCLAALSLMFVAGILAILIRRWRGKAAHERVETQRRLLGQLDRLDQARLSGAMPQDAVIVSAADLLRRSLRLREGPRAEYRTTQEWLRLWRRRAAAGRKRTPDTDLQLVVDAIGVVLGTADQVKFAQHAPSIDEVRACIDCARRVIQGK